MNFVADPTNATSEADRYWTTANIGEATPDVLSPLCWSFWGPVAEAAARRAYHRFGILSRRELAVPSDVNQLMTGHFYGRPALNVDLLRPFFGSLPGVSADDFERDLCGRLRPNLPPASRKSRLPIIVVRGVLAMKGTPRRQRDVSIRQRVWWENEVRNRKSVGEPLELLDEAADRFREAFEIHCCGRFILMSAHANIAKLAGQVGRPEQFLGLLSGLGGVTEVQLADDLWQVSRGQLTIETFVDRHGFHGPNEGNLTARSWREDASPVEQIVESLKSRPDHERPRTREISLGAERASLAEELIVSLPSKRRSRARKVCEALVASTQANELSKAAFLMAIDGARSAARAVGDQLVINGVLDSADDVFFLTREELHAHPGSVREIVRDRRDRRQYYRTIELPVTFTGTPQPLVRLAPTDRDSPSAQIDDDNLIRGAAGAAGVVEGRARVIIDPETAEFPQPGEILVCRFTDPSWTPILLLAAGVVIDIGGPASHGAIVARELGVPCVIGVGDGTLRIRTGDQLIIDGSRGEVQIVDQISRTTR